MKIGFFTDTYLPIGYGLQISVETFRRSLEKLGHEVYVYTPYIPGYRDEIKRVFRFESIKMIKNPEMRLSIPMVRGGAIADAVKVKLDIVHVHTIFSMGFLGKYVARRQKIPMVYTHHTDYPEYAKAYLKEKLIIPRLAKKLSALFGNWADMVIAPSVKIEQSMRDYGVKTPITVLPTGIEVGFFKPTRKSRALAKELRKKLGVGPKDKMLLSLGRIGEEKNLDLMLDAFHKLIQTEHHVKLIFVGDGEYRKKLQKRAEKLGLGSKVVFAGFIGHDEKASYYQAADIFLFTSLTDTQGIVIMEAMASGLPVVALQDDALKGILQNGKNGYFIRRGGSSALAAKIRELIINQGTLRKLRQGALRSSVDFSEDQQAQKLLDIYKGLVSKK